MTARVGATPLRHTEAVLPRRISKEVSPIARSSDPRFSKPLYTVSEAASYVGVPRSTFATWMHGYVKHASSGRDIRGDALLTSVGDNGLTVPFIGLAEGMVLAAFRETGLPLQRIRAALARLEDEHELEHALASKHLYTDGAEILYDYAKAHDDKQLGLLTVVRTGQRVFHDVIERYLKRIEYRGDWACRLILPTTENEILVVDPARAFGQPVFKHGGARLVDVRNRVLAGESVELVADDYGVPIADVQAALGTEAGSAAA
jgi:uncharacterized protein (DUF433 family)